jgi:hypothetical protein
MQLSSSLNGAPVAVPTPASSSGGSAGTDSSTLNATAQRVPEAGVVVELSREAESILSESSGSEPIGGNPLAPSGLSDVMADVEIFGVAGESDIPGVFQLYKDAGAEAAEEAEKLAPSGPVLKHDNTKNEKVVQELTEEEKVVVDKLKARDSAVRAHEMAHVSAAGGLAGAPVYSYQTGPDGQRYAIGGSVSIDTSPERSPEDTSAKAQRIRSAALAPADPSSADRAVASSASRMEAQARQALAREQAEESKRTMSGVVDAADVGSGVDLPGIPSSGLDSDAIAVSAPDLDLGRSTVSSVIPGGIATLASSGDRMLGGPSSSTLRSDTRHLHSFSGGSAAVAQLYTPTERVLEAAFLQYAS